MAVAERKQAIFEGEFARGLLLPQPFDDLVLGGTFPRSPDRRHHRLVDPARGLAQEVEFTLRLDHPEARQRHAGVRDPRLRNGTGQRIITILRHEARLDADPAAGQAAVLQILADGFHGVDRAPEARPELRHPEGCCLVLVDFHLVCEIADLVRLPLYVDEGRKVAALPNGIHGREKDELVAAEQIADIVLGRRHKRVEARLLQRLVQIGERIGQFGG